MKKIFLTVLTLIVCCHSILQAEIYKLTLEGSIELAKQKSYNMQLLKQDLKIAEYNLKSVTSGLKSNISMTFTLPNYTETVRERADSAGVYYSVKGLTYGSSLNINQPLPTDGRIYIQSGLSTLRDYDNEARSANVNTRFGITQPIDALYGYNSLKSSLKRAQLAYEQSNKSLKREELNLVYDVSQSYYRLLSVQKREEFAHLDLERQTEAFDISRKKYEAGLIREVDALQMEVDLAEAQSNYDIAVLDKKSAANAFKQELGINLEDSVVLDSNLQYQTVVINPENAVQLALVNRLEIREQDIQIELQKLNIKQQRVAGMVRGNLNAYYEKIGVATNYENFDVRNAINSSFNNFSERPSNFGFSFTISIPILDWGQNRALVRAAEARLQRNIIQKSQLEVNIKAEVLNLVDNINTNLKRLQLLEKSLVVAQKSFDITLQRYSDGDIDSQSLALERNRLNTSYSSHLNAYINYQLSLADLMRKTFYDFQNNQPVK
jgi:outer membrane protein TolC